MADHSSRGPSQEAVAAALDATRLVAILAGDSQIVEERLNVALAYEANIGRTPSCSRPPLKAADMLVIILNRPRSRGSLEVILEPFQQPFP